LKNRKIATKFGSRRLTMLIIPTVRFQTGSRNKAVSHMRIEKMTLSVIMYSAMGQIPRSQNVFLVTNYVASVKIPDFLLTHNCHI